MQELMNEAPFRVYAAVSAVLIIKMVLLAFATIAFRVKATAFANPEDMPDGRKAEPDDTVERLRRIHRNDLENILPFVFLGMLYVLVGAPLSGIQIYGYTFLIARFLHSAFYFVKVSKLRSLMFAINGLCLIGMCVQILIKAFGS